MEAISSDLSYFEENLEPKAPSGQQMGQLLLISSLFISFTASLPLLNRKKRIYSPLSLFSPPLLIAPQDSPPSREQAITTPPLTPRCSEADAAKIREIFETIDRSYVWQLANPLNAYHLFQLGNELRQHQVHPFEFLRRAPRDPLRSIFRGGNIFKIEGVMKGVREGMERERSTLERYLPSFAVDMRKSPERIRPLIQGADWRGLVEYLFDIAP